MTGPGVDTRRRWILLGVAVVIFLIVLFLLSRVGAERGNEVRFGFPDAVNGMALTKPDRAPEARNRTIVAHYDRRGDGLPTVVVEWLPHQRLDAALDGGEQVADGMRCVRAPQPTCATKVRDGVVRVTQGSSDINEVRHLTQAFLAARVKPDTRD